MLLGLLALLLWPQPQARSQGSGAAVYQGAHEVTARVTAAGARLVLRNGIALTVPSGRPGRPVLEVWLAVATRRLSAQDVAAEFIPVGPTLELRTSPAMELPPLVLHLSAERFRVRQGHRLVLALSEEGCNQAGGAACVRLLPGKQSEGECNAELAAPRSARLQLGSLPEASP